ncbi:recombinase family protein [Rhizobium sp. RAF56]|uniref:recombinase family protein n=1 Tax=Rhizobium sp. RAF56 TaxID=3233062 RepID=UPI003F980FD6
MLARLYLRASTDEQDAQRARQQLEAFATERGLTIATTHVENESGAKLARPELFRLLSDARPGDVLLIEQVDRLSRLTADDWQKLRAELSARKVRVVALDLPTSWTLASQSDDFTGRMFAAINDMMLDVLAAVARKDYDDRRRRQSQGQAKAKAEGRYRGRAEDTKRNASIATMLARGMSWTQVQAATGCSRATVAKIAKRQVVQELPVESSGRVIHVGNT